MSVINQMLQDLDARRAEDERRGLPNEVRPLPGHTREAGVPWRGVAAVLLLASGAAGGAWFYFNHGVSAGASAARLEASGPPAAATGPEVSSAPLPGLAPASPGRLFRDDSFPSLRLSDILSGSASRTPPRETAKAPVDVATAASVPKVPGSPDQPGDGGAARMGSVLAIETAPAPVAGPVRIEKTPMQPTAQERAEAEYRRGLSAINQGGLREGGDALRQALKLDAQHAAARQLLLRLLLEQRNQDEARSILEEAVRLQPSRYQWALALARLQVERGDAAGAWQALQGSMAAGAGNADYQGLAGNVLQRLGRFEEAAEHYRGALRIAPGEGRWWLGLALALEADGNTAEARQAFLSARSSGTLTADMAAFVDQRLR